MTMKWVCYKDTRGNATPWGSEAALESSQSIHPSQWICFSSLCWPFSTPFFCALTTSACMNPLAYFSVSPYITAHQLLLPLLTALFTQSLHKCHQPRLSFYDRPYNQSVNSLQTGCHCVTLPSLIQSMVAREISYCNPWLPCGRVHRQGKHLDGHAYYSVIGLSLCTSYFEF